MENPKKSHVTWEHSFQKRMDLLMRKTSSPNFFFLGNNFVMKIRQQREEELSREENCCIECCFNWKKRNVEQIWAASCFICKRFMKVISHHSGDLHWNWNCTNGKEQKPITFDLQKLQLYAVSSWKLKSDYITNLEQISRLIKTLVMTRNVQQLRRRTESFPPSPLFSIPIELHK